MAHGANDIGMGTNVTCHYLSSYSSASGPDIGWSGVTGELGLVCFSKCPRGTVACQFSTIVTNTV